MNAEAKELTTAPIVGDSGEVHVETETAQAITEGLQETATMMREEIKHLMTNYPYVSRAMIQVSIGPNVPPRLWGPILQDMIAEGEVVEETISTTTPKGRNVSKKVLHLGGVVYPPVLTVLQVAAVESVSETL